MKRPTVYARKGSGQIPLARASSAERRPNTAYAVGLAVQTIKATVMRTSEELDSPDVGEVEIGTECVVKAIGTGETGRRLLVCISDGPLLEGWISCENAQGERMLKIVGAPDEDDKEDCDGFSDSSCDSSRQIDVGDGKHTSSSSTSRSMRSSNIMPFDQALSVGMREEGSWEYICVDPKGIRLRAEPSYTKSKKCGAELKFGQVVSISSRGVADGITWLCLADGRGWGFQRTNRLRMSEVTYSEAPADLRETSFILDPKAESMISIEETPITDISNAAKRRSPSAVTPSAASRKSFIDFRGEVSRRTSSMITTASVSPKNAVPPGMELTVLQIASVSLPSEKTKEIKTNFYQVRCDGGREGWLLDSMVRPCRMEVIDKSSASKWISVIAASPVPVCATPSRRRDAIRCLQPGDFVEVEARCFADDLVFFQLALDRCWICEMGSSNKPVVELAFKDVHNWVYECTDKDGAVLRDAPTRVTSRKAGQKIKLKQRIVVSERAQLASGDVFLHIVSPTDGWIPAWKLDGSEKKVQQINEVERDMDAMTLARMLTTVERE